MPISLPKLKAMMLFWGTYTDQRFLGKTKLMKLFYFADFLHVKKYGSPITWDTYVNLEHGPIPTRIMNLVDTAEEEIDTSILADTISVDIRDGANIHRIIPSRKFTEEDTRHFSETELKVLDLVIQRFGDKNTKFIEDASHKEAPWRKTVTLQEIPYTLAAEDADCLVTKDEIETMMNLFE